MSVEIKMSEPSLCLSFLSLCVNALVCVHASVCTEVCVPVCVYAQAFDYFLCAPCGCDFPWITQHDEGNVTDHRNILKKKSRRKLALRAC